MRIPLLILLFFIFIGNDRYIYTEDAPRYPSHWDAGLTLSFDNDAFSGTDDHYTNGIQLSISSHGSADHASGPFPQLGRLLDRLPGLSSQGQTAFTTLSISQRIFTPEDITTSDFIPDDVPYSGHLTFGLAASSQSDNSLHAWSLQTGIIGPGSLADDTQRSVHKAIGGDHPAGWRNQLPNEFLLNIGYEYRARLVDAISETWGMDMLSTSGAMVGNLITQAHAGVMLRAGYNIPRNFSTPPPFMGEELIGSRSSIASSSRNAIYTYLMLDTAFIPFAAFWDGTLFRDSHSIDHDHLLSRAQLGLHVKAWKVGLDLGYVMQTIPWDNGDDESVERYGRLKITMNL